MATARLVPSTYYLSNSSYLSVSDASNMYTNTDSDTYSTTTNSRSSTTSYYIYLRGFNFSDIPAGAIVSSFTIKIKARESGVSTSSSYAPRICNGTTTLTGTCSTISTTATTLSFSGVTDDWDTISGYGSSFGIRVNCRRSSSGTTSYMYIYGAEILVEYTVPSKYYITSSLVGNGTINPSGTVEVTEGDTYTLTVTPTNPQSMVTIQKGGTDVTSSLIEHRTTSSSSAGLGAYTLVSGSFSGSGATYFEGIVGNGVDATQTTENYYSSGSGSNVVFTYDMGLTVPSNTDWLWDPFSFVDGTTGDPVISRVYCEVNGHAESTSNSGEYMCVQLKSGSTALSSQMNFKDVSTSNTTITVECTTLPTAAQLEDMVLECTLGYYGGAINGATVYVEYYYPTEYADSYTYSYTVTATTTIVVTITESVADEKLYFKNSGSWVQAIKAYKKVNGVWQIQYTYEVADSVADGIFESGVHYKRG